MRKKLLTLLIAAISMALVYSCSSGNIIEFEQAKYLYCVYPVDELCLPGPSSECLPGGMPMNECPANFSKQSKVASSSSNVLSSSSLEIVLSSSSSEIVLSSSSEALCGGEVYNSSIEFCYGGVEIKLKCGAMEYGENQFCYKGQIYSLCGDVPYNPELYFCLNGEVVELCGGLEYKSTQFCHEGRLYSCGNKPYNPATHLCHEYQLYSCDNKPYNPITHSCYEGQVYSCGNKPYNPATHSCHGDQLYSCGNKPYNPSTQFCYKSSKIGTKCGTRADIYDPDIYQCKPSINSNGIYLKTPVQYQGKSYEAVLIGEQTWFAENLNYNAAGSKCYAEGVANVSADSIAKNCDTYGRLYNWATALAACPAGWHLPTLDEWNALASFIESDKSCSKCATQHLMTSDWSGLDAYGFAALPGGDGDSGGSYLSSLTGGNFGIWWSATEGNSVDAYGRLMYYSNEYDWYYDFKTNLYSVRCLQD